jgi:hypothetical protein
MNYAAAFAQALNEDLDRREINKTGFHGVQRPDPTKVTRVTFEGEEEGGYSEYTQWNAHADLFFTGNEYGCCVDMHQVGNLDLGAIMQRAAELMAKETS